MAAPPARHGDRLGRWEVGLDARASPGPLAAEPVRGDLAARQGRPQQVTSESRSYLILELTTALGTLGLAFAQIGPLNYNPTTAVVLFAFLLGVHGGLLVLSFPSEFKASGIPLRYLVLDRGSRSLTAAAITAIPLAHPALAAPYTSECSLAFGNMRCQLAKRQAF